MFCVIITNLIIHARAQAARNWFNNRHKDERGRVKEFAERQANGEDDNSDSNEDSLSIATPDESQNVDFFMISAIFRI